MALVFLPSNLVKAAIFAKDGYDDVTFLLKSLLQEPTQSLGGLHDSLLILVKYTDSLQFQAGSESSPAAIQSP